MKTKKSEKADLERKRPLFFMVALVITLGLIFAAFSWKTPVEKAIVLENTKWETPDDFIMPSTKEEKKEVAPPLFTVDLIELVDNTTEIDDDVLDIFDTEVTDQGIDVKSLIRLEEPEEVDEKVYIFVDEMPEFPGGMGALLSFIGKTVKYPLVAQEAGVKGKVYVGFVINKNGEVSDARIIRGVDAALNKEALRVVNMLPNWKPGMQSGKTVRVSYSVPINFVLN